MILYLPKHATLRNEQDEVVISTLLRKGWKECTTPPEYDSNLQTCAWDNEGEAWVLSDLPPANPLDVGCVVQPEGFTLAMKDSDRMAFTSMLTLVQELQLQGFINDLTPQSIADKDGAIHEVTTKRFRQIMIGYGLYFKTLWDASKA